MDHKPRESINAKLEQELSELHFSRHAEVLRRTHPQTAGQRLKAFWNKEIELPVIPIGTVFAIILSAVFLYHAARPEKIAHPKTGEPFQRQLVEAGGNVYWKDEYERMVAKVEASNKD